jgi:tRNA threonylcarbamoyladenosine biosynthesis protein TsaB
MNVLCIETAGSTCGAVVITEGVMASEASVFIEQQHDAVLQSVVGTALAMAKCEAKSISAVAVNCGPGSFTGLRIGAAFAKGFCAGGTAKLLPVSSLEAFASAAQEIAMVARTTIVASVGSHRNMGYIQQFEADALGIRPLTPVANVSAAEASQICKLGLPCGSWAPLLVTDVVPISGICRPSPRFVARRAMQILQSENPPYVDPVDWTPTYHSNTFDQPPQQ